MSRHRPQPPDRPAASDRSNGDRSRDGDGSTGGHSTSTQSTSTQSTSKVELLGKKLRRLRKVHKLSTAELAKRTGIDAKDLARIERGEGRIGIEALFRLLTELQVDDPARLLASLDDPSDEPRERFRRNLSG